MPTHRLTLVPAICALMLATSWVSPEELRREDEATCAGYGFKAGTPDFATCLQPGEPRPSLHNSATAPLLLGILGPVVGPVLALVGSRPRGLPDLRRFAGWDQKARERRAG